MNYFLVFIFVAICDCSTASPISSTDVEVPTEGRTFFEINGPNEAKQNVSLSGENNFQATQQLFYFFGNKGPLKGSALHKNNNRTVPDGYTFTSGIGAHKLHLDNKAWNEARKICIGEGGHLAIITSEKEEAILQDLRNKNNVKYAHIGMHNLFAESDWTSVLDQPLNKLKYLHWSDKVPNLPDNLGGHQNCGALMDGGMDDVFCGDSVPFFCKIYLD